MYVEFYESNERLTLLASDEARIARDDEAERAWQDMFNEAMTEPAS